VPADNKWFTRAVIAAAVIDALDSLGLEYPELGPSSAPSSPPPAVRWWAAERGPSREPAHGSLLPWPLVPAGQRTDRA